MKLGAPKTAAQAAANYGTNGGSAAAANAWAQNLGTNFAAVLAKAAAAVGTWQANVSTLEAASNFQGGLQRAAQNVSVAVAKINGPSKATFSAQVKVASTGNYQTFATKFIPAVDAQAQAIASQNPGTDSASGTARMLAMNAWLISQKGNFRVK
jgi:hypothetical protein